MDENTQEKNKGNRWLKRIFKILGWTILSLILIVVIALGAVVWVLTPERLTPMVEKYANEFLDAKVNVERVELTFWKTFPQLRVDVDSLSIVSNAFDALDDDAKALLPSNADTLLTLQHFHGGVGLTALASGKIEVYEVELRRPMVNMVVLNDSLSNFDIVPASEPDTTTTTSLELPDIAIDRFIIADALPITYRSYPDNLNFGISLGPTYVDGNGAPQYELSLTGDAQALLPPSILEKNLPIGLNGKIQWSPSAPFVVELNDFAINVAELKSSLNAAIDMSNDVVVNSLDYRVNDLPISAVMAHLPKEYKLPVLQQINTNLAVSAGVTLLKPYNVMGTALPHVEVSVELPKGSLQIGNKHKPLLIEADLLATVDGDNLNASMLNVKKFNINGESIDVELDGTFASLLSDPSINANFKGGLNFNNLPPIILNQIPGEMRGRLTANTSMRFRQSQLSKNGFHKVKIKGEATLHDFTYADSVVDFYTRETTFKFGTSNSFVNERFSVDSMLTASIKIDTARVEYSGSRLVVSKLRAGVGSKNISTSTDSTIINPMRASIRAERVMFHSTDSTRMRLRDIKCMASLRRFKEDTKTPELALVIDAGRINYGDQLNRINLREGNVKITAHLKKRKKMNARMQARYDSIAALNPHLPSDSIIKLARASMRKNRRGRAEVVSDKEIMDFALDNDTKTLLRRWNVHGKITAKRVRLFTPYFPLRNTLKNVDIDFTTDSLMLNNITYKVGKSDFLINGAVRNISRALTSRRGAPLMLDFSVRSDTVDVNQLAEAVFAGAAFGQQAESQGLSLGNIEDEDSLQVALDEMQDTTQVAAVLVPTNIEATIRLRAHNVIYADMLMKRMRGIIMMKEGALNMHNLTASTDIGTIGLSALYTAPSKKDLSFGFGLQVKDLQLNRFINMIPAVDSLMPMLKNFEGIIDADIAATTQVDTAMNLVLPSLNAAIKLHGDSLVLLDADTFKSLSKWLMFKNKKRNMIDNMTVEILVENSMLELFPFMFDIDRYRLGIMGSNDMAFNFNYHVSVLKSPLPFKFGLTVKGNADDMKIRVGKAKFKENMAGTRVAIVDTTRVNLLNQIENVFRRGVASARLGNLDVNRDQLNGVMENIDAAADTISHADSLLLIKEGILPAPIESIDSVTENNKDKKKAKK